MTKRSKEQKTLQERFVEALTRGVGSTASLVLHSLFFAGCFVVILLGADLERVLLVLTTVVSLEAIYLALFIQMTVNRASDAIEAVEEDIDEIQEDVAEIEKDIDEIEEDTDAQEKRDVEDAASLKTIEGKLAAILEDLEKLRKS